MRRVAAALVATAAACVSPVRGDYQDRGAGPCTVGGQEPNSVSLQPINAGLCEFFCSASDGCWGYSVTDAEECTIWLEGPLTPSELAHDGARCIVKDTAPEPPRTGDFFRDAGEGYCMHSGQIASGNYSAGLTEAECLTRCAQLDGCHGFGLRTDLNRSLCVLYREEPLAGHGPKWGNGHCMIRERAVPKPWDLAAAAAMQALPLLAAVPTATFEDAGPGDCAMQTGAAARARLLLGVPADACAAMCAADHACAGFARQSAGACKLYQRPPAPLVGGGPAWGDARCLIKAGQRRLAVLV